MIEVDKYLLTLRGQRHILKKRHSAQLLLVHTDKGAGVDRGLQ
jgi:hypothetical protein